MVDISGTPFDDNLVGTPQTDNISGLEGNDIIDASGSDSAFGGEGDDELNFGRIGSIGLFTADGGNGRDSLFISLDQSTQFAIFSLTDLIASGAVIRDIEYIAITGSARDEEIYGSSFDESIVGGLGIDFLYGLGGNDSLLDQGGANKLFGGDGNDNISIILDNGDMPFFADGGDGNDLLLILGVSSTPFIFSLSDSLANGSVASGIESFFIRGFNADDIIIGSVFDDTIHGLAGDDQLFGGDGNDNIQGNGGADQLFGEAGDDSLSIWIESPANLSFLANGGDGLDQLNIWLNYANGIPYNLDEFISNESISSNIENILVYGSNEDDQIIYTSPVLSFGIYGGGGNDSFTGGDGTQFFNGESGNDSIHGEGGDDALGGGEGDDYIDGGLGNDQLYGGEGSDSLTGSGGDDTLDGGAGQDWLMAGADSDTLNGGNGHDSLWAGGGNDLLEGGAGDDTLSGNEGMDTVTYATATSGVEINLSWLEEQNTRGAGIDTLVSIENLVGSAFDDRLAGNAANNILTGGGGADRFVFAQGPREGGIDTISDFDAAQGDKIELSATAFGLAPGSLAGTAFVIGTAAGDADDRLIYNSATGALWFDPDGSGAGAAVHFAGLQSALSLAWSDFFIV